MYAPITTSIDKAVSVISQGRVVAFPTGTSYGLAVDALQGYALQRLRNLKHRPLEKTFTVFVQPKLVGKYFMLSSEEKAFIDKHQNQAVTILLSPKKSLEHLAHDGRVGLRIIDHPMMQALADNVEVPLTATSANISGEDACYTTDCITDTFPGQITLPDDEQAKTGDTTYDLSLGCILDGGTLPSGRVSTIVKLEDGSTIVVRPGVVSIS